jgi:hypothetical protein
MGNTVGGFDARMSDEAANLQVQLVTEIITPRVPIVWVVITHSLHLWQQSARGVKQTILRTIILLLSNALFDILPA